MIVVIFIIMVMFLMISSDFHACKVNTLLVRLFGNAG